MPEFFATMPYGSGVFVSPIVPTNALATGYTKPGDVDLLIVPYWEDELILDQTLAIEIKAIRANYANQGKSPNGLGFTQAKGLMNIGFPYVGVGHLIVSDKSPPEMWRPMHCARILDEHGAVEMLPIVDVDWMPMHLTERAFGRLQAASDEPCIGLCAAYMGAEEGDLYSGKSTWYPNCASAAKNPSTNAELLIAVGRFFEQNVESFMDIPRHDPR